MQPGSLLTCFLQRPHDHVRGLQHRHDGPEVRLQRLQRCLGFVGFPQDAPQLLNRAVPGPRLNLASRRNLHEKIAEKGGSGGSLIREGKSWNSPCGNIPNDPDPRKPVRFHTLTSCRSRANAAAWVKAAAPGQSRARSAARCVGPNAASCSATSARQLPCGSTEEAASSHASTSSSPARDSSGSMVDATAGSRRMRCSATRSCTASACLWGTGRSRLCENNEGRHALRSSPRRGDRWHTVCRTLTGSLKKPAAFVSDRRLSRVWRRRLTLRCRQEPLWAGGSSLWPSVTAVG